MWCSGSWGHICVFLNLILARVRGRGNGNDRILVEHRMTAKNGNGLCGEGEWKWQNTKW
jgi:hypothetical protein